MVLWPMAPRHRESIRDKHAEEFDMRDHFVVMRPAPSGNRRRALLACWVTAACVLPMLIAPYRAFAGPSADLGHLFRLSASNADSGSGSGNEQPPQFILKKGRQLPVCKAYTEVLNNTHFDVTPFCGRPDTGPPPDFVQLERHYYGVDQIWPLFTHVWEFMRFQDQFHVEKFYYPLPNSLVSGTGYTSTNATTKGIIEQFLRRHWMLVWDYQHKIDIENDGIPERVLIWQGYGATDTGQICGFNYDTGAPWRDIYVGQRAFILSTDGRTIDERRTEAVFGAPANSARRRKLSAPSQAMGMRTPDVHPFVPLADSIGIFGYGNRYYIESENRPKVWNGLPPPVRVYFRTHGRTKELCTIQVNSVPVPQD